MTKVRNETILKDFGRHLATLRKNKGLTQEDLANVADISLSQVSRIERGVINPTLSTLVDIANALEIPLPLLVKW
ncbi:MAG: helix-turn-helix transcriptional regulator [Saprospiraceae bacterium]|nr:helix-turn-helix transcriptional regulator [Saprospiraceae bacterium]HPG05293.1 helix-turn-helix transcriptional regulator [Saprospiraceae bacterium]